MKELLNLCTKSVHFILDGNIQVPNDGVVMGSPLGPVLANIFYGRIGTIGNTNSTGQDEVLGKVC